MDDVGNHSSAFLRLRSTLTRRRLRVALLVVVMACVGFLGSAAESGPTTATEAGVPNAPPTDNHTAVTESARIGTVVVYAPDGGVAYYNNTRHKYFDVDPVANTSTTIEYTATDHVYSERPQCESPPCSRNVIERVNFSTGDVTEIYARYAHREKGAEWHDADRVNETHVVLADIVHNEVTMVDTETEMIEWTWEAQSEFPVSGGGPYPSNWAHINDVEVLDDGRVMVSMRNHDQVVFIDPRTGMQEEWTLGEDGDHETLFEQHNPDYIPEERGGPAIVVSDSENGRVQEFQRANETWHRTWQWSDARLQWPRDVDRLPNGNTLITDTNGKRVIEVDPDGETVWQVELTLPYDAERLETGDESSGGKSASALDLASRSRESGGGRDYDFGGFLVVVDLVRDLFPARVVNAIVYVSPPWITPSDLGPAIIGVFSGLTWGALECYWFIRSSSIGFRLPLFREDD